MKKIMLLFFLLHITLYSYAQSKKEQILQLNSTNDSLFQLNTKLIEIVSNLQNKISEYQHRQDILSAQMLEKSVSNDSLKKEIKSFYENINIEAGFKYAVLVKRENPSGRTGTSSETSVMIYIENQLVDSFLDFGDPEFYESNQKELYLSGEITFKRYAIHTLNPNIVILEKNINGDIVTKGCTTIKIYKKDYKGVWKYETGYGVDEVFTIRLDDE